jgi:uncharacterized protein YndB with AHSA1/START domain
MAANADPILDAPVRKTVTVNAPQEHAFRVFTDGIDTWWPREHHIGKLPLKKVIVEGARGGRCYSEQTDGSECDWGSVLVWDPPRRVVLAWKINGSWEYEPDVAKSSEFEVRFTAQPDGSTRVDLEHRHFDRLGPAGAAMSAMVDSPEGWGDTLRRFAETAEKTGGHSRN